MVHTSGALGAEVLEPAMAAGTQVGAFHPLVAFADTERAVAALHGATIAIEGDDQLAALLADMAEALGATAVRLAPGSKAAYHAAAVLAAGGFVALLDAIAELGRVAGPGRGRRAGHLRPAHRGHAGQRPGPRHPGGADRPDDPRRRRDAATRTSRRCARTPPACCRCTGPRPSARSPSREARGALAPETAAAMRRRSRRRLRRPTDALPLRPMGHSIAAKYAARPAARFRPSLEPGPRAPTGSAARSRASAAAARRPTVLRGAEVGPLARLRAGWRAPDRGPSASPASGRPRPAVAMHWARSGRSGPGRRPSAATAPWRA